MSLLAYKVLHLFAGFLLFAGLGGLTLHALGRGGRHDRTRRLAAIAHGLALLLLLVSGFGSLARLGIADPSLWPAWVWAKLVLWLVLGGALMVRRFPGAAAWLWWVWPLLGAAAAALALYKPAL
jgi:hypothetical protein